MGQLMLSDYHCAQTSVCVTVECVSALRVLPQNLFFQGYIKRQRNNSHKYFLIILADPLNESIGSTSSRRNKRLRFDGPNQGEKRQEEPAAEENLVVTILYRFLLKTRVVEDFTLFFLSNSCYFVNNVMNNCKIKTMRNIDVKISM